MNVGSLSTGRLWSESRAVSRGGVDCCPRACHHQPRNLRGRSAALGSQHPNGRRNNTTYDYLLRGLVSCGQCRLVCGGRTLHPGYHYDFCRGRTDALRQALGERCTARYAPARALDDLVWQDFCRVLREPALLTHELERAQRGAWLPQALQARRQTLHDVLAQLERQRARLLDVSLAKVIEREEFERKRKEVAQSQQEGATGWIVAMGIRSLMARLVSSAEASIQGHRAGGQRANNQPRSW
jgi:hypothetical protein